MYLNFTEGREIIRIKITTLVRSLGFMSRMLALMVLLLLLLFIDLFLLLLLFIDLFLLLLLFISLFLFVMHML
jgi:hypothetical protein